MKLIAGVLSIFLIGPFAHAQRATMLPGEVPPELMGAVFVLGSTMPVENALPLFFQDEDLRAIKAYFAKRKIDLSKVPMNQATIVGDKIYYREKKFAQLQDNVKLKVNGYISEYEVKLTPAENFIRLFEAFEGKVPRSHASDMLRTLIPEANAAKSANSAAVAAVLSLLSGDPTASTANTANSPISSSSSSTISRIADVSTANPSSIGARFSGSLRGSTSATLNNIQPLARSTGFATEAAGAAEAAGATTGWGIRALAGRLLGAASLPYFGNMAINEAVRWYKNGTFVCSPDEKKEYVFRWTVDGNNLMGFRETASRRFTGQQLASVFGVEYLDQLCSNEKSTEPESRCGINKDARVGLNKEGQGIGQCNPTTLAKINQGAPVIFGRSFIDKVKDAGAKSIH